MSATVKRIKPQPIIPDLISVSFQFLELKDLIGCSKVCRQWQALSWKPHTALFKAHEFYKQTQIPARFQFYPEEFLKIPLKKSLEKTITRTSRAFLVRFQYTVSKEKSFPGELYFQFHLGKQPAQFEYQFEMMKKRYGIDERILPLMAALAEGNSSQFPDLIEIANKQILENHSWQSCKCGELSSNCTELLPLGGTFSLTSRNDPEIESDL